jgi:hypothetical protein
MHSDDLYGFGNLRMARFAAQFIVSQLGCQAFLTETDWVEYLLE